MDDGTVGGGTMAFAKYHGTGNDFVMLEDPHAKIDLTPDLVAALCDRHFGVGADGLIRVALAEVAVAAGIPEAQGTDLFMDYRNADGSPAEMCGNGVRCLAKLAYERGLTDQMELAVATRGGTKRVWLRVDDSRTVRSVTVDMGRPALHLGEIPMAGPGEDTFLARPFRWDGGEFTASAVSMGNPHLVVFPGVDPDGVDVRRVGPVLERDPRFPNKTNVEFVFPVPDGIKVRVWERGVGETMACGTGACAALVAAHLAGLATRRARVHFPGGALDLDWTDDGRVLMTGPAEKVFEGEIDPGRLVRAWRGREGQASSPQPAGAASGARP
jgi:diaminopimelate epimerase